MPARSIVAKATEDFGLDLVDVEKKMMVHHMNHDTKLGSEFRLYGERIYYSL